MHDNVIDTITFCDFETDDNWVFKIAITAGYDRILIGWLIINDSDTEAISIHYCYTANTEGITFVKALSNETFVTSSIDGSIWLYEIWFPD